MYVSTKRLWHRLSSKMPCILWIGLGAILALSSRVAVGQDAAPPMRGTSDIGDAVEDGWLFGDQLTGRSGEAFGVRLRAGVLAGSGVGRSESIVPLEAMPYAFIDNGMFFGDVRGFKAMRDGWGLNLGGGYRHYFEQIDRIVGGNVYYDRDNSSGALFEQVGFGIETLGSMWDARANAYFPQGIQTAELSRNFVVGSEAFVGNQILFDQRRISGIALKGVDMEVGVPIPGRIPNRLQLKMYGGWYYYDADSIDGFGGWKSRIQGNVLPSVELQLEVSNDRVFDTNVVFGAAWTYGGYTQPDGVRKTQFSRMTEPVRRMFNVSVARITETDSGLVAINPSTGQPYFVEHVASYAPGPIHNGTVENPFLTILDAQANPNPAGNPGGNIVFVHADSVYATAPNNSVLLEPSVRILGEGNGVEHRINIAGLGTIPVPRATANVNRPLFTFAGGDGVTLISGTNTAPSEFSGFQIGDPTDPTSGPAGHGIFGDTVGNVVLTQNSINFAQGDGIRLENLNGLIDIRGTTVDNTGNVNTASSGLHVIGGTGGVRFIDDPISGTQSVIRNTGGRAVLIENTGATSFVNLTGTDIIDGTAALSGQGILISNANGSVTIDTATITNSSSTGIDIQGGAAVINFRGPITIDNPTDDAINIENILNVSRITFADTAPTTITDRNARGLHLFGNAGTTEFIGPLSIQGTALAAAIDYQNNSGDALFRNIAIDGGTGDGIVIGDLLTDNSGAFRATGTTTITNVDGNSIFVTDDDSTALLNNVTITSRGLSGINILGNRGNVRFTGNTTVDNLRGAVAFSNSPAVDIQNNIGAIDFDVLTITNATRPVALGGGSGLNIVNNPGSVAIDTLNIDSLSGTALFIDFAGDTVPATPTGGVSIAGGTIDAIGKAVHITNSVMNTTLTSVSSSASTTEGILLQNNVGLGGSTGTLFAVTGINLVAGTGGTILNAALDGVFAQNTGGVSLAGMNITGSGFAGVFSQTDQLDLQAMQFTGNQAFGVETLNTPFVNIQSSTFTGNAFSEIRLRATDPTLTYNYLLGGLLPGAGNTITENDDIAVLIDNLGAGTGGTLNLAFLGNTAVSTAAANNDILNINWNGPASINVAQNLFTFNPDFARGVVINLPSLLATSNVQILSNQFLSVGQSIVGIDLTTGGGPSTISIGSQAGLATGNVMTFNAGALSNAVAMQFDLGANTTTNIFDNEIVMDGDLAQGILFTLIQGTSTVTINNNLIDIDDGPDIVDDEGGIIIQAISGNVTLFGTQNNEVILYGVQDTIFPWFSAPANINGSIILNGVTLP